VSAVSASGTVGAGAAVGIAHGSASIPVAVHARVDSVGDSRAVGAVDALRAAAVVVAGSIA